MEIFDSHQSMPYRRPGERQYARKLSDNSKFMDKTTMVLCI